MPSENGTRVERGPSRCPLLIPVTVDRLWMYPTSAYCHRSDRRVRVPAPATLERVCTQPGYRECAGYRARSLRLMVNADVVGRLWGAARRWVVPPRASGPAPTA